MTKVALNHVRRQVKQQREYFGVLETPLGYIGGATKEGIESDVQGELGITISLYF